MFGAVLQSLQMCCIVKAMLPSEGVLAAMAQAHSQRRASESGSTMDVAETSWGRLISPVS